jgi:NADH-quinone oxidoreductase subunit H
MLSYEVFMGLSVMDVVMLANSFNLRAIVEAQQKVWFFISLSRESSRRREPLR